MIYEVEGLCPMCISAQSLSSIGLFYTRFITYESLDRFYHGKRTILKNPGALCGKQSEYGTCTLHSCNTSFFQSKHRCIVYQQ